MKNYRSIVNPLRQPIRIIIITGYSGSGKSTALAALEDAGYYAVDNMPVALLPKFIDLPFERDFEPAGFAFVMDLREKQFLQKRVHIFEELRRRGFQLTLIFLEASTEVLLQRYSQTRRQHPLAIGKKLADGINAEIDLLQSIRAEADVHIDTSQFTVHDLKKSIRELIEKMGIVVPVGIQVMSFGFKYGIPQDADLLVDVRFLPNPYFIPDLKLLSGEHDPVRNYILKEDVTREFLNKYFNLIDYLIPLYEREGKAYLTLAIGCTGGRHRSVVIAQQVFEHIRHPKRKVEISHRDMHRENAMAQESTEG